MRSTEAACISTFSADVSADGKTLTLHYRNQCAEPRLKSMYVLDFGLPVRIQTERLRCGNLQELHRGYSQNGQRTERLSVVHESMTADILCIRPTDVLTTLATANIAISYSGNSEQMLRIGFDPGYYGLL